MISNIIASLMLWTLLKKLRDNESYAGEFLGDINVLNHYKLNVASAWTATAETATTNIIPTPLI